MSTVTTIVLGCACSFSCSDIPGCGSATAWGSRNLIWTAISCSSNTEKSGSKIFVPLPPDAVEALQKIENGSEYFFWTGNGLRKSAVADWQRALRRLFKLAQITGNPHMFRHTFATELLRKGVPIEDVSILLGHKSVKITETYYSHWIAERRERLEERVRELWT